MIPCSTRCSVARPARSSAVVLHILLARRIRKAYNLHVQMRCILRAVVGRASISLAKRWDTGMTMTNAFIGGGEMGERIRAFDWTQTPLGPIETWPHSLMTAVRIMLTSRQPFWLGWGDQLIKLYNDPYKAIVGGKHPGALGQPAAVVWREIWDDISPMLTTAMGGVEGTYVEAQLLIMERNGYPEETYYTFSYSPIPNDQGGVGGI